MADAAAKDRFPTLEYISEDDLGTFDGWLKFQAIDLSALTEGDAAGVRELFEAAVKARETARKVGRMKLKARPDESKYADAIRDGNDLWLALWVSRISRPPDERFINVREPLLATLDDLRDKPLQVHVRRVAMASSLYRGADRQERQ